MKEINILSLGAKTGGFDNSGVFESAFRDGNVRVVVPAGDFSTGPITLRSGCELHLENGALLRFIPVPALYKPVFTRWEGVRCYAMHPMIYAEKAEDVSITGEGTIDGQGAWWWAQVRDKAARHAGPETAEEKALAALNTGYEDQPGGGGGRQSQFLRPAFVQFNGCKRVLIQGISVKNSPFWTIHPVFSTDVTIDGIKICNPANSPNTDAIDIDSCRSVLVSGCDISVGDDALCMKSGNGSDGVAAAFPTENVRVENCTVRFAHGGAVIGSETAAGIKNVSFENCRFIGIERGIRVKTRRGRGGILENLSFRNIDIDGCLCPIAFNMYYKCGAVEGDWFFDQNARPVDELTPGIKGVLVEGVKASGCKSQAGFFAGLPESKIEGLVIRNSRFSLDEENVMSTDLSEMFFGIPHNPDRRIRVLNAELTLENVVVDGFDDPVVRS